MILQQLQDIVNRAVAGGTDSAQHLVTLFGISVSLRARRTLELGVRGGDTTRPLLLAAFLNAGTLTSIDCLETTYQPEEELRPHWHFIRSDTIAYLEWACASQIKFDLIFVDDDHHYEHVKRELVLISKLSDVSTVILMHDLMATEFAPHYMQGDNLGGEWVGGGPSRAVRELDQTVWEWATIPVNNGLTLLRKKI